MKIPVIPRRHYLDDVHLSVIGFGGMVLSGMDPGAARRLVDESLERGVNYFDTAPGYGGGDAERIMGEALSACREKIFLAGKTLDRTFSGAAAELERSLRSLKTERLDLYQVHAIGSLKEADAVFVRGGALEAFLEARRQGRIRYIGFSAHSAEAALSMMDRFSFDSVLFPINYICYARGNFGPRVVAAANNKGIAILAIKTTAHGRWRKMDERRYPHCWYRPIDDPVLARQAMRFALSENVTALLPSGDERLFRMALNMAHDLPPLTSEERAVLLAGTRGQRPLMKDASAPGPGPSPEPN